MTLFINFDKLTVDKREKENSLAGINRSKMFFTPGVMNNSMIFRFDGYVFYHYHIFLIVVSFYGNYESL